MMRNSTTRRGFLGTVGTVALGGLAVGSAGATAESAASLDEQLETVRQATAKYRSVGAALADGFQPSGPYVPGMGWHFSHPGRLERAAKNGPTLEEPPVLTYADTGTHLVLGAAEFALPVPNEQGYTESNQPDLFDDAGGSGEHSESERGSEDGHEHGHGGGETETWHTHGAAKHVFAVPNGERNDPKQLTRRELLTRGRWAEVPADADVSPGDEVTADWGLDGTTETRVVDLVPPAHPDLLTLHAWVHIPNHRGPFAAANPNLELVERLPDDMMSAKTSETASPK